MSLDSSVRLNKFISDSGHCSRREADRLIENRRVRVNGKLPEMGTRVAPGDEVSVDGMVIFGGAANKSDRVYIAYHKPVGITCTTEQNVKGNIVDAVDHDERVFPIGRLDKPSEGLILLTSDGDIVNKILRAENAHDKEYIVSVDKPIASDFASRMASGIPILGTVTKPCKVTVLGRNSFRITLTQGLNRQIRRMCEFLGYEVLSLKRSRIMNIELGKLRSGQWRNLTKDEMALLTAAVESSTKESSTKKSSVKGHGAGNKAKRPASASKTSRHRGGHGADDRQPGDKEGRAGKSRKPKQKTNHSSKEERGHSKGKSAGAGKRSSGKPLSGKASPKGRAQTKAGKRKPAGRSPKRK